MRFCYADPPYIGQARKHYGAEAKEVNHPLLIAHLETFDGWALSLSSPSLLGPDGLAAMAPDGTRIAAWVKPFASFKRGVDPAYAWEPVLYRTRRKWASGQPTCRDYVSAVITTKRGTSGAKPEPFCVWLFELLGMTRDDELVDLFPGSRAVSRAWDKWRNQMAVA